MPLLAIDRTQLLYGLAFAAILIAFLALRMMRRASTSPAERRQGFATRKDGEIDPQELPVEFLRWEVQMHDTARELKAELDSKMVALQILIRQSQEIADRLERQLREATKK